MNFFTARKYEDKVKSIITLSKENSISKIAEIANITTEETTLLIEKMIKKSKGGNLDYRIFKNAHVNYQENTVVLDESKSEGFIDKFGKMTNSLIDKFTPKNVEPKSDWKCSYCGNVNDGETYKCSSCNAKKE